MYKKIELTKDGVASLEILGLPLFEERQPWINKSKPALIVVPGGSYMYCSDREGLPVASQFMAKGYQTFVLNYHVGEASDYPTPLIDLALAVKHVKENASEYGIDPDNIALLGFSAGGHLVGTYGALIHNEIFWQDSKMSQEELSVKHLLLGYPAINLGPLVRAIQSQDANENFGKMFQSYDAIKDGTIMAHKDMPRTFIFHALDDDVVPAILTIAHIGRLVDIGVDVEFYMPNTGGHGFATGDDLTNYGRSISSRVHDWIGMADAWIKEG